MKKVTIEHTYYIYDNDNAELVCNTDIWKEAVAAVLLHLVRVEATGTPAPVMFGNDPCKQAVIQSVINAAYDLKARI